MCFSLFPSLLSPHPTSDSLFYENGLVDGSIMKKYIHANCLCRCWETMEPAHWPQWTQLSERMRARRWERWGGSGQGVLGGPHAVGCTRSLGYISTPAILESGQFCLSRDVWPCLETTVKTTAITARENHEEVWYWDPVRRGQGRC